MANIERLHIGDMVTLVDNFEIGVSTEGKNVEYYDLDKGLVYVVFEDKKNAVKLPGGQIKDMELEARTLALPLSLPVFEVGPRPYTPFRRPYGGINSPYVFDSVENGIEIFRSVSDPLIKVRIDITESFSHTGEYHITYLTVDSPKIKVTADRVSLQEVGKHIMYLAETPLTFDSVYAEVVGFEIFNARKNKTLYPKSLPLSFRHSLNKSVRFDVIVKVGKLCFPINIKFINKV